MNIVLVRHGRPTGAENQKVNSAGFGRWVKRYNHSLVDESSKPDLWGVIAGGRWPVLVPLC